MRKDCYLPDHDGPFWPSPAELRNYFLAPGGSQWISPGGNDNWTLAIQGIDGTDALPPDQSVHVVLRMTGHPSHGVTLQYDRWDGRTRSRTGFNSKGDLRRLNEFVRSRHGDLLPVGLFISFATAWPAVREFVETNGALPTAIEWIASRDLPPEAFPDPWPAKPETGGPGIV